MGCLIRLRLHTITRAKGGGGAPSGSPSSTFIKLELPHRVLLGCASYWCRSALWFVPAMPQCCDSAASQTSGVVGSTTPSAARGPAIDQGPSRVRPLGRSAFSRGRHRRSCAPAPRCHPCLCRKSCPCYGLWPSFCPFPCPQTVPCQSPCPVLCVSHRRSVSLPSPCGVRCPCGSCLRTRHPRCLCLDRAVSPRGATPP